ISRSRTPAATCSPRSTDPQHARASPAQRVAMVEAPVQCRGILSRTPAAWISFSCRDEHSISDGTPIAEAAARFRDHEKVLAVGINCTAPQFVTPLIREICRTVRGKAIVVYPNSGERYDA